MNKLKSIRKLTSYENALFEQNPTKDEIESREFSDKINNFYDIIASKKLTFKELIKLNAFPLLLKIKYWLENHINRNKYNHIKFGYISNYRFRHIEKILDNLSPIKLIYEFGSGGSTIVIAEILRRQFETKGIKGTLYTFDQSEEWLEGVKSNFPENLIEFVKFKHTDIKYELKYNFRFLKYDIKKYHENIDLVYIDGPTHQLFENLPPARRYQVNGNIVEMMKLKNFKYAFTDQRFYYFKAYKKNNFDNYSVNLDKFNKSITLKVKH